jgi:hypothetical protein
MTLGISGKSWRLLLALGLGLAILFAYFPCLNGTFVWDDASWTLNLAKYFQGLSGLGTIWTHLTVLQQYYPLTGTCFWIDYQLWGFWTLPYHVENVLLHILAAFLFFKLLDRLMVPGASFAAALFALHPMMVESVAWITERKNVLSLVLFLAGLLSYGRFTAFWGAGAASGGKNPGIVGRQAYAYALLLFLAAYLAKATAFAFPAVVLLICWWKRGVLRWRQDVAPTLPFFAIGVGLGLLTFWVERNHVGAKGPDWDLSD